jgi:hypothetical protein
MPNTLVHFAAQGAASRGLWPRLDARWIYLGCLLPDLPWILRRAVVGLGIPVDVFDLRLYTMALASLAGTLLLCAALAVATAAPRLVLAVLGTNALLHLLLDATELKFGNGVHLAAPFSWRMTSFELLPGESSVYVVLAAAGALLVVWELTRPRTPLWASCQACGASAPQGRSSRHTSSFPSPSSARSRPPAATRSRRCARSMRAPAAR